MFTIVKVKKVPRLRINIKFKIHKGDSSISNNSSETVVNSSANISLAISQTDINYTEDKECLENKSIDNSFVKPLTTIPEENTNEENTHEDETIYENHYISFIILYPMYFGKPKTTNINSILGLNMLVKRDRIIQTYKIKYKTDFKYKKFIRSKVLDDYNYKNKDISIIKSINTYRNYHNYVVVIKKRSVRNKLYDNQINSIKDTYKWKQLYDFYNPAKMTPELKEPTITDAYEYLSLNSVLKTTFTDSQSINNIDIKDVFKSISLII
tara:strand:+ start:58 stop:861 length:804 start_codon:yes stop_codon:yes gene_type:complete